MSSGMPELGSKISLISKADIRYEGRLFTVDPQECTIALASVRSFGTEDRETQYPVAPQSQVYDYILFRGSDIKDIRVLNNVPSLPNDPAIMQMSVPPTLGGGNQAPPQYAGQFSHTVVGQSQYPQYHPMAGFPGSVHSQMNKTSELTQQTSVDHPTPSAGPIGSGMGHHVNQVKDQGSMLDLIGGGSQQSASRSATPGLGNRKSPTADQSTQVGAGPSGQRDSRRGSNQPKPGQQNNRNNSRNRQRYPSGGAATGQQAAPAQPAPHHNQHAPHAQHNNQMQHNNQHMQHNNQHMQHNQQMQHNQHMQHMQHNQHPGGYRGGWRGRGRARGRGGFLPRPPGKNTLKFDNDYDFEQANTEFEELRCQLAKAKIDDAPAQKEEVIQQEVVNQVSQPGETDKKDDSGNETGAGEPEVEDDGYTGYDKTKSFFDNISCEAIERSKGRSQRTDWRTERKLNSETFGVASARRGAWRGRGNWRQYPHHQPWRPMRGNNRGRAGAATHTPAGGHIQRPRAQPPQTANVS